MTEKEILKVIDSFKWKFAKTMKSTPHWYIVRDQKNEKEYKKIYDYIKENHVIEYFYKRPYKYAYIGEYKYWFMSEDFNESIIINRARWKNESEF